MIKTFLTSMFAIFPFALGAAGAWFYLQLQANADDTADDSISGGIVAAVSPKTDPIPAPPSIATATDAGLPHAVRGSTLDAEQLYQLSTITETKRAELSAYEERLREQKLRIKAGDADVKAAQREVEGALAQVQSLMDATEKLLSEVKVALDEMQTRKLDIEQKQEALKATEENLGMGAVKNIKTFAEIIQSMPPDAAARTIKEMWNDGKMDFAIQLLRKIEPRNVAKILAEVQDPQLIAELASRYPVAPQVR